MNISSEPWNNDEEFQASLSKAIDYKHEAPFLNLTKGENFWFHNSAELLSVMIFPKNEEKKKELYHVLMIRFIIAYISHCTDDHEIELPVYLVSKTFPLVDEFSIDIDGSEDFLIPHSNSFINFLLFTRDYFTIHKDILEQTRKAIIVSQVLLDFYATSEYKDTKIGLDKIKVIASNGKIGFKKRILKDWHDEFSTVAHLWAAVNILHSFIGSENDLVESSLYFPILTMDDPEFVRIFFGISEFMRKFSENYCHPQSIYSFTNDRGPGWRPRPDIPMEINALNFNEKFLKKRIQKMERFLSSQNFT